MALPVNIVGGKNNDRVAEVDKCGASGVVVHPHPPLNQDECIQLLPFKQLLTLDGTANTSGDMLVDGSVTNVEFFVSAIQGFDLYIKNLSIMISDKGAALNKFGNIAALTNGLDFFYESQDTGKFVVETALQTNHDFVRLSLYQPMVGSTMKLVNATADQDSFIPVIDFNTIFGMQYGLRLRKNTNDRIVFTVKDDVTGIDEFDIIAYGIKIKGEGE